MKHTLNQAESSVFADDDNDPGDKQFIEDMIRNEFPEHPNHDELDLFGVIDSVISSPSDHDNYPDADWCTQNWVEMYGPDQQWHITTITRIDEREPTYQRQDDLIEEALFKTHTMVNREIDALRQEMTHQKESLLELSQKAVAAG